MLAVPEGPDSIQRGESQRASLTVGGTTQEAEGGNVTSLDVSSQRITKRWQGFTGNISGGITLEDAAGNALYDWGLANPSGEIYASNGTPVTWTRVFCVNFTADYLEEKYNLTALNRFIGLGMPSEEADDDSVNATFNQTYGTDGSYFSVGDITINNADNCSMATLYDNNGYQTQRFKEIILTDNTSIVFTSILEQDQTGFQGHSTDFQMIVGVNGTIQGTVRNYYFFVELS